jgi:preprotein translocase subunit SecY
MGASETIKLLRQKIVKILSFLIIVRLGLYIPVPGVDLDIFSQSQGASNVLGFARNLTGSSFLGVGSLGILPYINASIIIQLLTPIIPRLERLQTEGIRAPTDKSLYTLFNFWLGNNFKHSCGIYTCKTDRV